MYKLFLTLRYLRKRRIAYFAIAAVTLCVAMVLIVMSVMGGFLDMLKRQLQFDTEAAASLRKAFVQPYPRVDEGRILVDSGVKAAIDISDGLVSDLNQICKASHVGARLEIERVPIEPGVKAHFGERALELALAGGEDYELLFTGKAEVIDAVKTKAACPVSIIGEITAFKAGITLVDNRGKPVNLDKRGWDHFMIR